MTVPQKKIIYQSVLITILLLAVYGNTLNHGFVWDDTDIIVNNSLLKDPENILKFFILEDKIDTSTGYYRPITYVSFALDLAFWGLNPVGFNITNLVLHILVSLAFYRVVAALFNRENLAFFAGLIFSLHPIAGETINFHAGGRNTLLCAFFALLSLLFYIREKQFYAVACFTFAIFSKEFALLMPAIFFLYDRTIRKEKSNLSYLPYAVTEICYLVMRSFAVDKNANLLTSIQISKLWQLPGLVIGYLKQMAIPLSLKTMYNVPDHAAGSSFIASTILLLSLIGTAVILKKNYEILFSIFLFLIFLLPVSNLFNLGSTNMADRYAYFASFGFSLALAYCICLTNYKVALPILALVCAIYIGIDFQRNRIWKDNFSFFTQMTKDAPELSIGFQNLGYAYYEIGDYVNTEKNLLLSANKRGINSRFLVGNAELFWEMKKFNNAIDSLNKALELDPDDPRTYMIASLIYDDMGNPPKAKEYHDKAEAIFPGIFEMMEKGKPGETSWLNFKRH